MDQKTRAAIGRDYKKMPVVAVLRKYGISRKKLYSIVRNKRGAMDRKVDRDVKNTIATLNFRGLSDHEIAGKLNLSQDTVSRHRNAMGLPVVPRENRKRKQGRW